MKKLFTLVALLAMFLGAQAGQKKIYSEDYSKYTGFPFYVMGYVPEFDNGCMTDLGGNYKYVQVTDEAEETSDVIVKTQSGVEYYRIETSGGWHQYFIADHIPTEMGGSYHVVALVKASKAVNMNVNMGWGWGDGQQTGTSVSIPASDDFVEVEWDYTEIGGSSCNLVAQPNTDAQIEWLSLEVYEEEGEGPVVPQTWLQMLTNDGEPYVEGVNTYVGNAEFGAWPAWALEEEGGINANWRGDRTGEICAWSLTMGKNFDDQTGGSVGGENAPADRARPYPSDIEAEEGNETNHVFAVHVEQIDKIDDDGSIAWSNQFWIQSPKAWKAGTKAKVSFRYKAQHACNVDTQTHKIWPSIYDGGSGDLGTLGFTTEWQTATATIEMSGKSASVAFNLTSDANNGRTPNIFYFDDLSWEILKLDEGLFVAGKGENVQYDYAQAIAFEQDEDEPTYFTATIGTEGDKDTWVSEIQISTVRGDKAAFLGATLKPVGAIELNALGFSKWLSYTESSQAKIKLPAAGVWGIEIDTESTEMRFQQIEGDKPAELADIVTNPEVLLIEGVERDWLAEGEAEAGGGNTWDNQFFIVANRVLEGGEETVIEFDYVATTPAKVLTGTHAAPGDYRKNAFGDVEFTTEEQHLKKDYVIPSVGWDGTTVLTGMQSISFDMAVIKEANNYTIKNVKWYLKNDTEGKTEENLINATGTDNFVVKIGAGNTPVPYGTDGISTVVSKAKIGTAVLYNLAGQRVANDYKGIVVKEGKKIVNK